MSENGKAITLAVLENELKGLAGKIDAGFANMGLRLDDHRTEAKEIKEELGRTRAHAAKSREELESRIRQLELHWAESRGKLAAVVGLAAAGISALVSLAGHFIGR